MHQLITSPQNPKIKNLIALEKASERREQNVFIIEGLKEITLAIDGGYQVHSIFFSPEIIHREEILSLVNNENLLIPVQQSVFKKIAYRESTGGVIAVAKQQKHTLGMLKLSDNPIVLVLEGVEKPGNLGAVLRTADAAAIDAVIICDPQTDFYNPNVIRSSVGCVFTTQVASATSIETISWLRQNEIKIYCTYLQASEIYYQIDFRLSSAIIMGTEATGLSSLWIEAADANIIIPMEGKIDSMNVSTAASVVIFEAKRQRSV